MVGKGRPSGPKRGAVVVHAASASNEVERKKNRRVIA
jgi:hypothetical protein